VIFDTASALDVRTVARALRESDVNEFGALFDAENAADLAEQMGDVYSARSDLICARHAVHGPVAIGAMVLARPNVATLLFFATEEFKSNALAITRFIRARLFPAYRDAGVHRIECIASEQNKAGRRWIGTLGLQQEAVHRGYGRNGETFVQYAWVADHVR
jgi:hypothetical protein